MDKQKFIEAFVSEREIIDEGIKRESCLMIALENARVLNRCNKDGKSLSIDICGKLDGIIEFEPFIGLVNYLLILDMIGVVFGKQRDVGKRIEEVLLEFGEVICEKERKAISCLRNCLAHNYGLADGGKKIKFILNNSCDEMIILPDNEWSGNYSDKEESTSTTINPQKLIDKIEGIYSEVKKQVLEGKLNTKLTVEELKSRFTIIIG